MQYPRVVVRAAEIEVVLSDDPSDTPCSCSTKISASTSATYCFASYPTASGDARCPAPCNVALKSCTSAVLFVFRATPPCRRRRPWIVLYTIEMLTLKVSTELQGGPGQSRSSRVAMTTHSSGSAPAHICDSSVLVTTFIDRAEGAWSI